MNLRSRALSCSGALAAVVSLFLASSSGAQEVALDDASKANDLAKLYKKFKAGDLDVEKLKTTKLYSTPDASFTWEPSADIFDTQIIDVLERPANDPMRKVLEEYLSRPDVFNDPLADIPEIKAEYNSLNLPIDPFDPRAMPVDPAPLAANLLVTLAAFNTVEATALRLALESADTKSFVVGCSDAAMAMLALRKTLGNAFDPDNVNLIAEPEKALATVDEYVSSCLTPPEKLDPATRAALDSRVGVLAISGQINPYKCSVTRIAEDRVLTARHCLFRAGSTPLQPWPAENRYVYLLSAPTKRLAVLGAIHPPGVAPQRFDDTDDLNDWAILKIAKPPTPYVPLTTGDPKQFDRVIVYGYQPILAFRDRLASRIAKDQGAIFLPTQTWDHRVRYDASAICSLAALAGDGGCVLHGCQTEGGVSGAALFRVAGGGAVDLVGLHTRSTFENDDRPCTKSGPAGIPNCGLSAPQILAHNN